MAALDQKFQRVMKVLHNQEDNRRFHFNWNSPTQLKTFFYGMMGLKERRKRNAKGIFAPTVDAETLEFFAANYLYARPICNMILVLRDLRKQISFLKTEIDPDKRIRTNYNIAGTNTGRLSSSMNDFGTGTNLQNVDRQLRYPFQADPGMYMLNVDLEQADARNVGAICWNLFLDELGPEKAGVFLDATESGDLHTRVCRMAWPNLEWPQDEAEWKDFCGELIAHGQDSYRQLAKKLGHGTNYLGTPRTMAKHAHVPTALIENFQNRYFRAFPVIQMWHKQRIEEVKQHGSITTMFGRRRIFFDRGNDASTHRKAIAFEPQSCTGEEIDRGLYQVWKAFPQVQLLNQVHDSILLQLPLSEATDLVPQVLETMKVTLELKGGRRFSVPLEAAGGWNWGYRTEDLKTGKVTNPNGLMKWKGKETRVPPQLRRKKQRSLREYL